MPIGKLLSLIFGQKSQNDLLVPAENNKNSITCDKCVENTTKSADSTIWSRMRNKAKKIFVPAEKRRIAQIDSMIWIIENKIRDLYYLKQELLSEKRDIYKEAMTRLKDDDS